MLTMRIELANFLRNSVRSRALNSCLAVLVMLIASPVHSWAQTANSAKEDQVSALLAEIESENRTRSVYDVNSRRKIAEVPFGSSFNVVKNLGRWRIVEFSQRTVPGWVSDDYVALNGGRARIEANNLNMRVRPSLDSSVMLQLNRGYISEVIGRRNGFVRILAPSRYRAAIFSGSDEQARQSRVSRSGAPIKSDSAQSSGEPQQAEPLKPKLAADIESVSRSDPKSAAGETTSAERLHVISPGDAISLLVFGERDLSANNVRVPQSGRVSFPLIGPVVVAGRTIPQVEQSVAELLAQGYVRNPRLSVTMFSYRPIFIRGAIQQTGSFPFSEGLTIGTAIALAGGTKKSAKRNGVSILREGSVIQSDIAIDSQIEVQSGDVISIEEEVGVQEGDATYIYLHGEVVSPGEYQFRRGLTVEKAVVLAGGFTLRGSRKKISVTRYADVDEDQEPEKLKKVKLYTPIKPGDIINVGATWF